MSLHIGLDCFRWYHAALYLRADLWIREFLVGVKLTFDTRILLEPRRWLTAQHYRTIQVEQGGRRPGLEHYVVVGLLGLTLVGFFDRPARPGDTNKPRQEV